MEFRELSLFENAVDSIEHALEHFSDYQKPESRVFSDAKQCIINLVQAMDLLVLAAVEEIVGKEKVYSGSLDNYTGYQPTIHVGSAFKMLKAYSGSKISKDEFTAYEAFKKMRDAAVHSRFLYNKNIFEEKISFLFAYILRFSKAMLDKDIKNELSPYSRSIIDRIVKDRNWEQEVKKVASDFENEIVDFSFAKEIINLLKGNRVRVRFIHHLIDKKSYSLQEKFTVYAPFYAKNISVNDNYLYIYSDSYDEKVIAYLGDKTEFEQTPRGIKIIAKSHSYYCDIYIDVLKKENPRQSSALLSLEEVREIASKLTIQQPINLKDQISGKFITIVKDKKEKIQALKKSEAIAVSPYYLEEHEFITVSLQPAHTNFEESAIHLFYNLNDANTLKNLTEVIRDERGIEVYCISEDLEEVSIKRILQNPDNSFFLQREIEKFLKGKYE